MKLKSMHTIETPNFEQWKPIRNLEGHYEVSDLGRIRSLNRDVPMRGGVWSVRGRILKQRRHGCA